MRLIDADALMEHVYRDRLDSRELIADMVKNAPTIMDEISSDGTLTVTVPKGANVGRVLVQEDGTQYGGLFYPDEDRKRGKWIPVTKVYKSSMKMYPFPEVYFEWTDAAEHDEIEGVKCSECDAVYDFTEAQNFCPNCGARMDG